MLEKLKENLFVVAVGTLIIGATGYYVYANNQYKVDSKTSKGKSVLASVDNKNVYADDLYSDKLSGDVLYWQYRSAVVNESQETTKEIKKAAKKLAANIRSYYRSENSDDENQTALKKELAGYGFTGEDAAEDYAIVTKKEAKLDYKYIKKNYAKYATNVLEKKPRSVYLIAIEQSTSPSKKNTKKAVETSIKEKGFKTTAENYASTLNSLGLTDDTGFYGYMDTDDESNDFTSSSNSSKIPGEVAKKALKLKKGKASNWTTVTDSNGNNYYVKVYVDQTNLENMLNSSNTTLQEKVVNAFINANNSLNIDILDHYASKLKVTFKDKKAKKKLNSYLKEVRENAAELEEDDNSDEETSSDNTTTATEGTTETEDETSEAQ